MSEFPHPYRVLGERDLPREPYGTQRRDEPPADDYDRLGAEAAAALTQRLRQVQPAAVRLGANGRPVLSPPLSLGRDHFEGPDSTAATLVVFGAFGTPWSRRLGNVLVHVREHHHTSARIVWRHYPDPTAHPRAAVLALATEAAATQGRFWVLVRELLARSHDDPADLHEALLQSGLDPDRVLSEMQAGMGAERIADDVASARASGVTSAPALFVNGERYTGELDPDSVSQALDQE